MGNARLVSQHRSNEMLAYTLVELLVICVFISILFAYALERENRIEVDRYQQLAEEYRLDIARLRERLGERDEQLRSNEAATEQRRLRLLRIMRRLEGRASPQDDRLEIDLVISRIEQSLGPFWGVIDGRNNQPGPCLQGNPSVVELVFLGTGEIQVLPAQALVGSGASSRVAGLAELQEAGTVTIADFSRLAAPVRAWADSQSEACFLTAEVELESGHQSLELFRLQDQARDRYFYERRRY